MESTFVCSVELFFTQTLDKMTEMWSKCFFKQFSIHFQIHRRLGKRQWSLHDNEIFNHVDKTPFRHCKDLRNCHFFPKKRHSNPGENETWVLQPFSLHCQTLHLLSGRGENERTDTSILYGLQIGEVERKLSGLYLHIFCLSRVQCSQTKASLPKLQRVKATRRPRV